MNNTAFIQLRFMVFFSVCEMMFTEEERLRHGMDIPNIEKVSFTKLAQHFHITKQDLRFGLCFKG